MPWVDKVPALVQSWYGGNENGSAIADVVFGKVNPGGRMSLTFPQRLEDVPSFGHYGNENGKASGKSSHPESALVRTLLWALSLLFSIQRNGYLCLFRTWVSGALCRGSLRGVQGLPEARDRATVAVRVGAFRRVRVR